MLFRSFASIQAAVESSKLTIKDGTTDYFFMSNSTFDNTTAPASVYKSNAGGIQSLQEINPNSISKDATTAAQAATNVYVERAAAKVDLTFFGTDQNVTSGTMTNTNQDTWTKNADGLPTVTFTATGDKMTVNGWTLTVTNKSFYTVKMIDQTTWADWCNNNKYQMADHISEPKWFRSYWAIDPDYKSGPTASTTTTGQYSNFTYATWLQANNKSYHATNTSKLTNVYCAENTFNATNQTQRQTTAVLIAATYTLADPIQGDANVYSINGKVANANKIANEIADRKSVV